MADVGEAERNEWRSVLLRPSGIIFVPKLQA